VPKGSAESRLGVIPTGQEPTFGFERHYWLAAPAEYDATDLDQSLRELGWIRGPLRQFNATQGIERAELVIGVLGPPGSNERVFFELGIAVGRRKRVAVLAGDMSQSLPDGISPDSRFRTSEVRNLANWASDLHIASVARSAARGAGFHAATDKYLQFLKEPRSEAETVGTLSEVFKLRGARTYVEFASGSNRQRIDLAVWEPSLTSRWNPILCEVKRISGPTRQRLGGAVKQLKEYCQTADSRLGLIVLTPGSSAVDIQGALLDEIVVLTFTAEALVSDLQSQRLGPILMSRIERLDAKHAAT
jgi:hypothetical protein